MRQFRFSPALPETPPFTIGDGLILLGTVSALYAGLRLAFNVPAIIRGPDVSLSPLALPWYASLSVGRMAAAYFLSAVQFVLRLRRRTQPHCANGAHARARRPAKGIFATFLRVSIALAITLLWTIPVGVFIGTNRRLAAIPTHRAGCCIYSCDRTFSRSPAGC